jgi:hypothetical protein
MTTEDKQADRNDEPANGLTMQERAQKNRQKDCLDAKLDARVVEIVQAKDSEHDPED